MEQPKQAREDLFRRVHKLLSDIYANRVREPVTKQVTIEFDGKHYRIDGHKYKTLSEVLAGMYAMFELRNGDSVNGEITYKHGKKHKNGNDEERLELCIEAMVDEYELSAFGEPRLTPYFRIRKDNAERYISEASIEQVLRDKNYLPFHVIYSSFGW